MGRGLSRYQKATSGGWPAAGFFHRAAPKLLRIVRASRASASGGFSKGTLGVIAWPGANTASATIPTSAAASGSPPGNAAATAGRCRGSGWRQRWITRSTAGSSSFTSVVMLAGDARSCISISSISEAAWKARLPVNNSYSNSPSE
jgi:hypothetical protein